ncbi:hypothetical protein D9611_008519 [Ephemerocybe angulata]|uniref:SAP domain-containing protein n=1 Tax=Ephemerocybe angulata TaxID=980116 RepID=A0A8H5EV40_9AGAR|nr:hypothetical protein D9611_008519 [Tulosesus angulatus]
MPEMSSTTQILFNSPALHSLKRDQLVKLCKIHAIKASGKNVDLIEKLKRHAETLPKDDPLSIAVRGETNEHDDDSNDNEPKNEDHESGGEESSPCPSPDNKQLRPGLNTRLSDWEVVMYSIAEEDESAAAQGTVGSSRSTRSGNKGVAGEFGTGSSSKLGSSIKSLASSLGKLKKGHGSRSPKSTVSATVTFEKSETAMETAEETTDELEQTSQPYSTLPPTQAPVVDVPLAFNPSRMSMDGFLADGEAPLPGHALRPGVPAPSNGRLSLGLGLGGAPSTPSQPTTTIRLVNRAKDRTSTSNLFGGGVSDTPRLEPFKTSFDLIMGSPTPAGSLYPTLTLNDLPPSLTSLQKPSSTSPPLSQMDGVIEAPRPAARSVARSPDPFVFGSPLPQHRVSDVQFKSAAASVLEEMNKRLKEDGVEGVDTSLIGRLHPGVSGSKGDVSPREVKPMPRARGGEVKEKFNQAHQDEFQKMEGIDSFVKRRAAVQPQEEGKSVLIGKKRKSSVVAIAEGARRPGGARASGTRVVSKRAAKKTIPGAFGGDDDDDDDAADQHPDERAGKRIRIISDAKDSKADANAAEAEAARVEDEEREEKQRMAIKRKLEMNKAKRRSSTGPGMHGRRSGRLSGRPSIAVQPKPKPSRFAFLSSAKSLVQSVWGRGKVPQAAATTSNAGPKAPTKPSTLLKKSAPPTTAPAHGATLKPDSKSTESNVTRPTAASSARSRSPIPSFPAHSVRSSLASNGGTQTSKASGNPSLARKASVIGSTTNSRMSSAHVSSIGTRLSSARSSAAGTAGSMGVKKLSAQLPNASAAKPSATGSSSSRMSSASRLFAPTASSLAKMSRNKPLSEQQQGQNATPSSSIPVRSPPPSSKPNSALGVITNTTPAPAPPNTTNTNNSTNNLKSPTPFSSQTKGKIFSQPVHAFTPARSNPAAAPPAMSFGVLSPSARGEEATRQRSLNGRKPRISRSKVIARLASQRERAAGPSSGSASASASASGSGSRSNATSNSGARVVSGAGAGTPGPRAGKARSSLGAKVARSSLGGAKVRVSSGGSGAGVLLSAKKRARQSEYYRRRSRVEGSSPVKGPGGMGMDVDA